MVPSIQEPVVAIVSAGAIQGAVGEDEILDRRVGVHDQVGPVADNADEGPREGGAGIDGEHAVCEASRPAPAAIVKLPLSVPIGAPRTPPPFTVMPPLWMLIWPVLFSGTSQEGGHHPGGAAYGDGPGVVEHGRESGVAGDLGSGLHIEVGIGQVVEHAVRAKTQRGIMLPPCRN